MTLCNIIFAWDSLLLITSKQQTGHSLHDVLQILRQLLTGYDDNRAATAKVHGDETYRDAFISGISSISVRFRLLENASARFYEA